MRKVAEGKRPAGTGIAGGSLIKKSSMNLEIIQDRTFDAECAKRAGLIDLHDKIMKRLNATYPELDVYIKQCEEVYSRVGDFLTEQRSQYLKEHEKTLRLRYR